MDNTQVNRYEKVRKNQLRKALINLGIQQVDGWMWTSGEGRNRFTASGEQEITNVFKLLAKVNSFEEGDKIKEITQGEYSYFVAVDSDGNRTLLDAGGYVNISYINITFHSITIKYEDFNYGWMEHELY